MLRFRFKLTMSASTSRGPSPPSLPAPFVLIVVGQSAPRLAIRRRPRQQPAPATPAQPTPVFRSSVNLVLVDVVVRDRNGAVVKGLTADDFELLEDGVRQQIRHVRVRGDHDERGAGRRRDSTLATATTAAGARTTPAAAATPRQPATPDDATASAAHIGGVAGHRLLTLVFDTSSMQPEDVQKAADAAIKWVDEQMTPADLVAVASIDRACRS